MLDLFQTGYGLFRHGIGEEDEHRTEEDEQHAEPKNQNKAKVSIRLCTEKCREIVQHAPQNAFFLSEPPDPDKLGMHQRTRTIVPFKTPVRSAA